MKAKITILASFILVIAGCRQQERLVKTNDIEPFLGETKQSVQKIKASAENYLFWKNRLATDSGSYVNMMQLGYACMQQFSLLGKVEYLWRADSLFNRSNQITGGKEDGILLTLAQTAITSHRFSLAWQYVEAAEKISHDPLKYTLVRFDAAMESGFLKEADKCLQQIQEKDDFDYLIRKAKLTDHLGDLPTAIMFMEKALTKARLYKNNGQTEWALTNLSDLYGHHGEIKKAYDGYRQVLQMDPASHYALRGLGWLAFSHDKNTETAGRIFSFLNSITDMPDHLLILGEIAEYEGNKDKALTYYNMFSQKASGPAFGNMYIKYLISIYTNKLNHPEKALALAAGEIKNRYTSETINWLAWANFKNGNTQQAKYFLKQPLNQQNHEPDALWQTAKMLQAMGEKDRALTLLNELEENSFELGPNVAKQVHLLARKEKN